MGVRLGLACWPSVPSVLVLTSTHCDSFVQQCIERAKTGNNLSSCQQAALMLRHHMKPPSLPIPSVRTFTLATECLLISLEEGTPAHRLLVQLQQQVWQVMHQVLGCQAAAAAAYLPALNLFEPAEAMQVMLLLAQNGLPGLGPDCCLALALMEPHHLEWVSETFGTAFLEQVEALADQAFAAESALEPDTVVRFPARELPRLAIASLPGGGEHFTLEQGSTPWWMVPAAAWQATQVGHDTSSTQKGGSTEGVGSSAAEKLVQEYGHLDPGPGKRGKKRAGLDS